MKFLLSITFLLFAANSIFAQGSGNHKRKNSTSHGTMFFLWGYNRSWYTNSDIRFVGSNYDFKLKQASASDRPSKFNFAYYFNPRTLTIPQYNTRIGYYFMDKWAITLGWDHMKYVLDDNNEVLLDGKIAAGVDSTWSGNYDNQPVITDRDKFHYENTNGVNLIRVELMRSFSLISIGKKKQFALTAHTGIALGPVLTFNDLNFGNQHTFATPSISGAGIAVNGTLRAEFFKHFFMQASLDLGAIGLPHVRTRAVDRNQFARQSFAYSQYFAAAGWLFYIKPKKGCDSCPIW